MGSVFVLTLVSMLHCAKMKIFEDLQRPLPKDLTMHSTDPYFLVDFDKEIPFLVSLNALLKGNI